MTTDDFTDAAEDAASRTVLAFIGNNDAAYGYSSGFTTGAEWARDYLTEQEPTDVEVKRASCGCDLTGLTPPAVHLVDDHEGARQRLSAQEPTDAEVDAVRKLRKIRKLNDRYSLGGMVPCDEIDKVLDPDYADTLEAPAARRDEEKQDG